VNGDTSRVLGEGLLTRGETSAPTRTIRRGPEPSGRTLKKILAPGEGGAELDPKGEKRVRDHIKRERTWGARGEPESLFKSGCSSVL